MRARRPNRPSSLRHPADGNILQIEIDGERIVQSEFPAGQPEAKKIGWTGTYRAYRETSSWWRQGSARGCPDVVLRRRRQLRLSDWPLKECDGAIVWTSHPWVAVDEAKPDPVADAAWPGRPASRGDTRTRTRLDCDDDPVGLTVVIVDDHRGFGRSSRALLEAEGFTVLGEAADGASGRGCARLDPDVVLLDVILPDLDGFEVCARLAAGGNRAARRAHLDPPAAVLHRATAGIHGQRVRAQGRNLWAMQFASD